jgi:hypothetical protein
VSRFTTSRWRFALLPALLLPQVPLAIRNWAFIKEAGPIWLRMLGQALAVIASAILLAGIGAALVAWRRAARSADV